MPLPTYDVFWWQMLITENPHFCMRILHAAMFQIFRGASILLRVLAVTESQET